MTVEIRIRVDNSDDLMIAMTRIRRSLSRKKERIDRLEGDTVIMEGECNCFGEYSLKVKAAEEKK